MELRKGSWDIRGEYSVTVKSVSPYNNQFPMLVKDLKKPQDYLSLISLKDEVLDPQKTLDFLKDTKIVKIPDGDHRITDFAPHVEEIMSFIAE